MVLPFLFNGSRGRHAKSQQLDHPEECNSLEEPTPNWKADSAQLKDVQTGDKRHEDIQAEHLQLEKNHSVHTQSDNIPSEVVPSGNVQPADTWSDSTHSGDTRWEDARSADVEPENTHSRRTQLGDAKWEDVQWQYTQPADVRQDDDTRDGMEHKLKQEPEDIKTGDIQPNHEPEYQREAEPKNGPGDEPEELQYVKSGDFQPEHEPEHAREVELKDTSETGLKARPEFELESKPEPELEATPEAEPKGAPKDIFKDDLDAKPKDELEAKPEDILPEAHQLEHEPEGVQRYDIQADGVNLGDVKPRDARSCESQCQMKINLEGLDLGDSHIPLNQVDQTQFVQLCQDKSTELFAWILKRQHETTNATSTIQETTEVSATLRNAIANLKSSFQQQSDVLGELIAQGDELQARVTRIRAQRDQKSSFIRPLSDGKYPTFEKWLVSVQGELQAHREDYPTAKARMCYVRLNCIREAGEYLAPRYLQRESPPYKDAEDMFEHLKLRYGS